MTMRSMRKISATGWNCGALAPGVGWLRLVGGCFSWRFHCAEGGIDASVYRTIRCAVLSHQPPVQRRGERVSVESVSPDAGDGAGGHPSAHCGLLESGAG